MFGPARARARSQSEQVGAAARHLAFFYGLHDRPPSTRRRPAVDPPRVSRRRRGSPRRRNFGVRIDAACDEVASPQAPLVPQPTTVGSPRYMALLVVSFAACFAIGAWSQFAEPGLFEQGTTELATTESVARVATPTSLNSPTTKPPSPNGCGFTPKGTPSGLKGSEPCYCSPTSGNLSIKVKLLGCVGAPFDNVCPHVKGVYENDPTSAHDYPYPHSSILNAHVVVNMTSFKSLLGTELNVGSNWWKPDFTHVKLDAPGGNGLNIIELENKAGGHSTTLDHVCDVLKTYDFPDNQTLTACDGQDIVCGKRARVASTPRLRRGSSATQASIASGGKFGR